MEDIYEAGPDVHVLPSNVPVPGVGVLPVNCFLLRAAEPVLVDTGMGVDAGALLDAVSSVMDLADLRWIWLTHDDSDHTGCIQRVMEMAPKAKLVTNGMSAVRMASWWPVPLDRVHAIRPGDELSVGDRTLRAVAPPLFDNPTSVGFLDTSTGSLFSVDSFGAIIPAPTQDAGEVPDEALTAGMTAWATFDSPWTRLVDGDRFGQVLDGVRKLDPGRILSSHLPAAGGDRIGRFLDILAAVPEAEPFPSPSKEQFDQMALALAAIVDAG